MQGAAQTPIQGKNTSRETESGIETEKRTSIFLTLLKIPKHPVTSVPLESVRGICLPSPHSAVVTESIQAKPRNSKRLSCVAARSCSPRVFSSPVKAYTYYVVQIPCHCPYMISYLSVTGVLQNSYTYAFHLCANCHY